MHSCFFFKHLPKYTEISQVFMRGSVFWENQRQAEHPYWRKRAASSWIKRPRFCLAAGHEAITAEGKILLVTISELFLSLLPTSCFVTYVKNSVPCYSFVFFYEIHMYKKCMCHISLFYGHTIFTLFYGQSILPSSWLFCLVLFFLT